MSGNVWCVSKPWNGGMPRMSSVTGVLWRVVASGRHRESRCKCHEWKPWKIM